MLNKEQIELQKSIKEFTLSKSFGFFGVLGSGGTGKTYTVCKSIDVDNAIFLGATNKVCNVLRKELVNNGYLTSQVKTIDSFFGFKIVRDHDNNVVTSYKMPIEENIPDIIVVDEISLINNSHFENLNKLKDKRKIILIGDNMQIPPIEDDFERDENGFKVSKIFNQLDYRMELTIQNRQKIDSELFALISGFRNNMYKQIPFIKMAEIKTNQVDILYYDTYNNEKFKDFIKNNDVITVGYKNLTCLSLSWLIGSVKNDDRYYKVNELNIGDVVYFDSFYRNDDVAFYTSDTVEIINIKDYEEDVIIIGDYEVKYNYKVLTIKHGKTLSNVKVSNGYKESIYPFYYRKKYLCSKTNNKKELAELHTLYSDFTTSFAKLKKPYAITAHKAQGSTYDNVVIPVYDFYNKHHQDVNQLMYVAMSRAKKKIIFINRETNFDYSNKRYNFTELEKTAIASKQDYQCKECSLLFDDNREFDIDHVIPLSKGGHNTESNLQALCKKCHLIKTKNDRNNG